MEKAVKRRLDRADYRRFFTLFFPALAEGVLNQLFGMADTAMLGHMKDSATVIAAVGATAGIVNLTLCVTQNFNIGTTTAVAWAYGGGKYKKVRSLSSEALGMNLLISVVISLVCFLLAPVIVPLVCSNPELHPYAITYYRIVSVGFLFMINTQCVTALLRGVGYTKIPMIYNLSAGILNVFLNWCLIGGNLCFPALGVKGAAIATVVSQGVALVFALCFLFMANTPVRIFRGDRLVPTKATVKEICSVGIMTAAEQVLLQGGNLISTRIVSVLPTTDYAAFSLVGTVEGIVWAFGSALCTASTTLTGQCAGEGDIPKTKAFVRVILLFGLAMAAGIFTLYFFAGTSIAALFTEDREVAVIAGHLMHISGFALPFIAVHLTLSGVLRAAHDTKTPLLASFSSLWIFRVALGYLLITVLGYGIDAARLCIVLDQAWRALVNGVRYLSGKWIDKAERASGGALS